MSAHEIRVIDTEAELITAINVFRTAMVGFPQLTDLKPGQIHTLMEPGRTIGAFVDGQLVGTTDAQTSTLTLPGGKQLAHAAVTHVGVLPTFTRRGIATDLMRAQLQQIRDGGEAVATLRASEATIYERFGYGVASSTATIEVDVRRATLRSGVARGGPVRLVDVDTSWELLPQIYTANRPTRPGSIDRPAVWWHTRRLKAQATSAPNYVAVQGDPGSETGFVRYHAADTDGWFVSNQRTVVVDDLFAPTSEAYLALVRYLLELDLIDRVVFPALPVDDPMPMLLTDRRAARITGVRDETWLRIVDVAAALVARTYTGDDEVTLRIEDTLLPENSRTFRIAPDGATATDRPAQLVAGVEALGAVLLGGSSWRSLVLAGSVRADNTGAVDAADRLFAVPEAPYAGIVF
ncbi:GNAT family N-acetyltransferase [Mycolicibacterium goodii]|uniref:GNAT family N-acetyltransferase n=1 Tax=Mycolicibacterium goodii TaxID=134601 RepID=A0ABS6HG20_MYCGD|nr:GNAT family N-acetyltransferase [Mycolicibacterium goodii]MBU8821622.1 GNAT family N-acetyltransferase [Mycolicibacterium goodii]MBU8836054.1 GNAT family N-acetyltransferase [Mycolicibacterium goodii]